MTPAALLMQRICIMLIQNTKAPQSTRLVPAICKIHAHPQSLSNELPGSSPYLLCQQLSLKHPDTSLHIHNYTRKKLMVKNKTQKTALLKLSTHEEDERDTECSKNTLECTLFSFFLPLPLSFSLKQQLKHGSSSKQRVISAAFYGRSKVWKMIKYTYSLLFISSHRLCISVDY